MESRHRWRNGTIVVAAAAVAAGLALTLVPSLRDVVVELTASLEAVRDAWWSPLAFIVVYALVNVVLAPATPLSLLAGAIWGWWAGGLLVLAASTLGSLLPYLIARKGAPGVERFVRERAGRVLHHLRDEGFLALLVMRLVPLVPYNILNYAAGFAGLRARDYIAATFLGTIPGIFIFTYLADSIRAGVLTPGDAFFRVLGAGLLFAALVVATRYFAARLRVRKGDAPGV